MNENSITTQELPAANSSQNVLTHQRLNNEVMTRGKFAGVIKSSRYLSDFEDNVLQLDLSKKRSSLKVKKPFILDLNKLTVNLSQGSNLYKGIVPLTQFPEMLEAMKIAINGELKRFAVPAANLPSIIWSLQKLITYLLRNSFYTLGSITRAELISLVDAVSDLGWFKVLDVEQSISSLIESIKVEPSLGEALLCAKGNKYMSIKTSQLAYALGVHVAADRIPSALRECLVDFVPGCKPSDPDIGVKVDAPSASISYSLIQALNALNHKAPGFDGLSFKPFHDWNKYLIGKFGRPKNTGVNLPIAEAVKIFTANLNWLYSYRPTVLEIFADARATMTESGAWGGKMLQEKLGAYKQMLASCNANELTDIDDVSKFFREIQIRAFSACASMSATNSGRRINEVVGSNLEYGFYFGCVRREDENSENWRVDIFVQKQGSANWFDFACNGLLRDSVSFLEDIAQATRPRNTAEISMVENRIAARSEKLFRLRDFRGAFRKPAEAAFDWSKHSKGFLQSSGVDMSLLKDAMPPFRRMFISLYIHRFEFPELLPLHQHIRQLSLETLMGYAQDSASRDSVAGVEATMKAETSITADLHKLLKEGSLEYLKEYVLRMLRGDAIGGGFARIVKEIAFRVRYRSIREGTHLSEEFEVDEIVSVLDEEGYTAKEKPSGPCTATSQVPTADRSKCWYMEQLHPEEASPQKCCGCIHSCTSPEIRRRYEIELDELKVRAADYRLPKPLRNSALQAIELLEKIVNAEEKIAARNQVFFRVLKRVDEVCNAS